MAGASDVRVRFRRPCAMRSGRIGHPLFRGGSSVSAVWQLTADFLGRCRVGRRRYRFFGTLPRRRSRLCGRLRRFVPSRLAAVSSRAGASRCDCLSSVNHTSSGPSVGVRAVVHLRVDQRERDFRHAGRFAVARAGEDDVFHLDAAQALGGLLAQHPGDGVGDVRLAAQPLGPTIAAIPWPASGTSVRSQNDLKPRIWTFLSLSMTPSLDRPRVRFWKSSAKGRCTLNSSDPAGGINLEYPSCCG